MITRYMDDTIFLVNTYDEGKKILEEYAIKANLLNIEINNNLRNKKASNKEF